MKHPIQPLEKDKHDRLRFKRNEIVCKLLEEGPFDMNAIARWDVSRDDRIQFAQLIGYSLGGFGELSYVDDETYGSAQRMVEDQQDELHARLEQIQERLDSVKDQIREGIAELFEKHPSDLE